MQPDQISSQTPKTDRGYAADLLILVVAAVILLWGLGNRGLWHSEGRWAEIPREMSLTGDYFHPTIGGKPYFDKPVGTYWMVALAAKCLGGYSELAARLPSAIAGLIVIGCTLWLGRRLWSAPVAWIAAAIVMTSYGFVFWSRTADADIENLAAVMLALCWYMSKRD
ncbi:MAG TPA: glycosyltransferase family 39 protein, partial [Phycisphaerae bacterium]|nr:glycosyltransferase family 39 protein [Phycisphaerae bacterium]